MSKLTTIIPAAGYGTRLGQATKALPKEMMVIDGKPAISWIVDELKIAELKDVIIISAKNKESIQNFFDKNLELEHVLKSKKKYDLINKLNSYNDMNIVAIRQKEQKGLGHAICTASNLVKDEPFIVSLPDMLIKNGGEHMKNMINLYEKHGKGVIALMQVPTKEVNKYGIVSGNEKEDIYLINNMVEKPDVNSSPSNLAIVGRYILPNKTMLLLEKTTPGKNGEIQLTDALKYLAQNGGLIGYIIEDEIHDIGTPFGLLKANGSFGIDNSIYGNEFKEYLKKLVN